ncbi:MAG TPA: glucoamylase family protein [Terracidiphilus sp.]|nr:glucoamylase family protein [Terracidiphilus sp.]
MNASDERFTMSRRAALKGMAAAAGLSLVTTEQAHAGEWHASKADEAFLEDLIRRGCLFFWEQASEKTGQVLDRARHDMGGARDPRRMASIAATGFGLTALCIADRHGYFPHAQIVERVRTTLHWHLNTLPEVHGFYYHFNDIETGARIGECELSSIDSSLLLCGVLTVHAHFEDAKIKEMSRQIYERVEWPWMLDGGDAFSMGWKPESGFLDARWSHYCELMMIYLLAMGSPTHPVAGSHWNAFSRPAIHYKGYSYISGDDPLFTHQYSQAWYDFRHKHDAYANYFENSVTATRAHEEFCTTTYPKWYNADYWGISASDFEGGYTAWGGPPPQGPIDGTVVPCAAAGSLAFLPQDCLHVLQSMRAKWGRQAWTRYGFVDAFHPAAQWYDPDVLGIDQGISVLMAENLRTGMVWETFMRNAESREAMRRAGFHGKGL